jgi:hypothetical protein
MPFLSLNSLSLSVCCGCLNCYHVNVQRPAYGVLGHMPIHFRDWHVVVEGDRGSICVLGIMLTVKTNKRILPQLKLYC